MILNLAPQNNSNTKSNCACVGIFDLGNLEMVGSVSSQLDGRRVTWGVYNINTI